MDQRGPILAIPVPLVTKAGRTTQIVAGVIATQGGPQMTVRVGGEGDDLIVPGQSVLQELIQAFIAVGQKHVELTERES